MIRRLLDEIRERSFWQVLALYVADSLATLEAMDVLIGQGILPDWVFRGAFVLLAIGLPIVLATAFVQRGVRTAASDASESAATDLTERDEPAAAHVDRRSRTTLNATQRNGAVALHRLLTWRNATIGGVAAFAILGLTSAGYMGMRTLGIGAPGTLMARGTLEHGAQVVVADFAGTGDAEIADVVTRALTIDLLQSPAIRVLDRTSLADALARMQADDAARLDVDRALQLAEREGFAAVVAGEVATVGAGYVLTASILGPGAERLAGFRETARDEDALIDAVERLSRSIRDRIGESLRSIQGGAPLAQVTTSSLPALRAYTRALDDEAIGHYSNALESFETAVALDSTFAMAHRKIAVTLGNIGGRDGDMRRAARRAWELSERLPEAEREFAAAYYHGAVSGNLDAAVRAYERILRLDPTNRPARNNLGAYYYSLGRYAESEALLTALVREYPDYYSAWVNLMRVRFSGGDYEGALAALDSALVAVPTLDRVQIHRASLMYASGDYAAADSVLDTVERTVTEPSVRAVARELRMSALAYRGRLREALQILDAPGGALFMDDPDVQRVYRAQFILARGDTAGAIRMIEELQAELTPNSSIVTNMFDVLAEAGDMEGAASLVAAWDTLLPRDERGYEGRYYTELADVRLAAARGDYDAAITGFDAVLRQVPTEAAWTHYYIGRMYDDMGRPDLAARAYEAGLESRHPTRWNMLYETPWSLRRLAEYYDQVGNVAKATAYYARFIELWRDADPELQPQVEAAQRRLDQLLPDR